MLTLLIGDVEQTEFRRAAESIAASGAVHRAADPQSAAAFLREADLAPDVIVVAVAYPGQFAAAGIEALRRAAPLARVVALLGSWCEGEMRSGHPWPGVVRIYWHQWLPRWRQELARIAAGQCPDWGLPVTATDEERLLAAAPQPQPSGHGLIVLYTPHAATAEVLMTACRSQGHAAVWLQPSAPTRLAGAAAGIFDATDFGAGEEAAFRRLAEMLRPAPIVVLIDFPRTSDYNRALAAGAAAVLSKPLRLDDLWWQLEECGLRKAEG